MKNDNEVISTEDEVFTENKCLSRIFPTGLLFEFKNIWRIALPLILCNLMIYLKTPVCIMMCGQLSTLEMDAVSLALSMLNTFGYATLMGLTSACESLFAQAYGSEDKKRMGIFLQRGIYITTLITISLVFLFVNLEPLLVLTGQEPDISKLCQEYLNIAFPGLLFYGINIILFRYMQNQDKILVTNIISAIGLTFCGVSQYLSLYVFKLGFLSSAVCLMLTDGLLCSLSILYINISKLYLHTWDGWSKESLTEWMHFMKLGLPGIGVIFMENISWEIAVIMGGIMGKTELAVMSICLQLESIGYYTTPSGLSTTLNNRVGQYLGHKNVPGAVTTFRLGILTGATAGLTIGTILIVFRFYIPQAFSNDPKVIEWASDIIPWIAFVVAADSFKGSCWGVMKGCAKLATSFKIVIVCFYVVGVPAGLCLTFLTKIDIAGYWIGIVIAVILAAITFVIILINQDWEEEARKTEERLRNSAASNLEMGEKTPLINQKQKQKQKQWFTHFRTPSQPMGCSVDPVELPKSHRMSNHRWRKVLYSRIALLLFALGMATIGIILSQQISWRHHLIGDQDGTTSNTTFHINSTDLFMFL